jgi:hypothetical protein
MIGKPCDRVNADEENCTPEPPILSKNRAQLFRLVVYTLSPEGGTVQRPILVSSLSFFVARLGRFLDSNETAGITPLVYHFF